MSLIRVSFDIPSEPYGKGRTLAQNGGCELDWPTSAAEANWQWIGEFLAREWGYAAVEVTGVREAVS